MIYDHYNYPSNLSSRAINRLSWLGIHWSEFDFIAALSPKKLLSETNFGKGSLINLRAYLVSHGRDFDEIDVDFFPVLTLADADARVRKAISIRDAADKAVSVALAERQAMENAERLSSPDHEPKT